jgi:hypothetical protein
MLHAIILVEFDLSEEVPVAFVANEFRIQQRQFRLRDRNGLPKRKRSHSSVLSGQLKVRKPSRAIEVASRRTALPVTPS